MKTYERIHKPAACTGCGGLLDSAAAENETNPRAPTNGDHVVCIECGELMVYKVSVTLVKFDAKDLPEKEQRQLLDMQMAVRMAHEDR